MNNEIDVPACWRELAEKIYHDRGAVIVLGSPDTGKTTLINYLFTELNNRGKKASSGDLPFSTLTAIIDADIGQSFYGVPTTINLVRASITPTLSSPVRGRDGVVIDRSYFVGSTSPQGHLLQMVVGLRKLLDSSHGCNVILIDTTGFVIGGAAWELKYQKIEAVSPRHIVAIQRADEIENILHPQELRGLAVIHRIPPVRKKIKPKSQDQRRAYRQARYRAYFQNAERRVLSLKKVSIINPYRVMIEGQSPFPPSKSPSPPLLKGELKGGFKGTLIGLNNSENLLICLGILDAIDTKREEISCLIPSPQPLSLEGRGKGEGIADVKTIRLGSVRLDSTYMDYKT